MLDEKELKKRELEREFSYIIQQMNGYHWMVM